MEPPDALRAFRRSFYGCLHAALDRGRIDDEALRRLFARRPLALGDADEPLVFAVDASVWPRCDAECSPQRGYYYHPSRHSAGQPIVAGWAYQFVAQLSFARESWTAPVDMERVRPDQEVNAVATEQVGALLSRLEAGGTVPLFVFHAFYDHVKLQQDLEVITCQILIRLRAVLHFYGNPSLCNPPAHVGRPRRH